MDSDLFTAQPHSRRSFLKASTTIAAAAAAAHTPLYGSGVFGGSSSEYGGLVVGFQSYTFRSLSLEDALAAMHGELKIHAVELFPHHLAGKSPEQVKALLKSHEITPLSYGVIPFNADDDANRKIFELAKTYGMMNLTCDPHPDALESIDKLTEEYGITVAIHPQGVGHRWATTPQLERAFAGRSTRIGLCADTGHVIRGGEDPLKVMHHFHHRLHAVHLKDFASLNGGTTWQDVPAGTANLDVNGIVKFLIDTRSHAPVFIEYEGADPVHSGKQSLDRVRKAARKAKA